MNDKPEKFIDENGLRLDGRQINEIRPMTIKIGVLSRADGSCYLEWGNNKILAAVYGPRELHPRRLQKADSALIRYRYNMAAFSVEDRIRPGPSRRSIEISKVSREAFEPVVMTQLYPSAVIDVFAEVLQADAGTRTAAINAASIALADAGIPMKGLVAACAAGKVDGKLVLDLNKPEDNYGQADLPIAMTEDGEITLLQMDGDLTQEEFKQAVEMCKEGCRQILAMQQETLRNKFTKLEEVETSEDEEDVDVSALVESALVSSEEDETSEDAEGIEEGEMEDDVEDAETEDEVESVEEQEDSFQDVDEEDIPEDNDEDVPEDDEETV
ncbi:exosome complex exonuclease Rrp41 [Methanolobus sp. ZRKC4]|uniref:exosome complex exonuclease Rrp41 n=1 Tax=Methanolobus sp. ZRKC4 TaxID=3125787 RepID=UPI0032441E36